MEMKVAVDVTPLKTAHQFRGIGAYTKRLVEALQSLKVADFSVELIEKGEIPKDCDIVHYPYFDLFWPTLPLIKKKKTVVTIHDVIPLVFPEQYPPGIKGNLRFQKQKLALKTVNAAICDSKNSKKDIVKYLGFPKDKIFVVYLAAGEEFKKLAFRRNLAKRAIGNSKLEIQKRYHLPNQFVLYVGDVNYNKNIRGLVKACEQIKTPLVIVGKQAVEKDIDRTHPENRDLVWLQDYCQSSVVSLQSSVFSRPFRRNLAKRASSVILTGFVPDEDLVIIYSLASVYCQPSFYEGFGLPVLEAMACGTPVVTSKKSSLPEVAGKAAIMVDPNDINDIANGLTVAIEDENLREDLIQRGLEQAKKFSWEKVANETYKVYQKVV